MITAPTLHPLLFACQVLFSSMPANNSEDVDWKTMLIMSFINIYSVACFEQQYIKSNHVDAISNVDDIFTIYIHVMFFDL